MIVGLSRADLPANLRTLAIAAAGGVAFDLMGAPAPYLSGAILACSGAALSGFDQRVPPALRNTSYALLGVVVGSTIDADTLGLLPQWPVSLAALVVAMAALLLLLPHYFTVVHGIDRSTARLCAIPGALSLVMAMADDLAVDTRRVAVLQSIRLIMLMILVPMAVGVGLAPEQAGHAPEPLLDIYDAALLLALSVLGIPVAALLRIPAPSFTGPMLASGALFAFGVVSGALPEPLIAIAFVVMGASIGARFSGIERGYLVACLGAGVGGILIAMVLTGLVAWPTAAYLDLPFIQIWLAIAPGGFDAMTALSLALDVDPAFVAGHQLVRLIGLFVVVPFLFRETAAAD